MKKKFETKAIRLISNSGDMELLPINAAACIAHKNNTQMKLTYIIAAFIAFTFYSCSKGLDPKPTNVVLASEQFSTNSKANDAVVGLYSSMAGGGYTISYFATYMPTYTGLSADELFTTLPGPYNLDPFFQNNSLSAVATSSLENLWSEMYNNIYQANAIIDNVNTSTGITAAGKAQFTGEAKFARALNYFYLVNMFGSVPLAVTSDYHLTAALARAPVATIYTQMISDLNDAAGLLTDTYYTTGKVRANKAAALALLARVYLYKSDWVNTEKEASLVIGDNNYKLETSYSNIFLSTSNEAIFQFYNPQGYTAYGALVIPNQQYGLTFNYGLDTGFVNGFENGDLRKAAFTDSLVVNGDTLRYPNKYKNTGIVNNGTTEYYMVLRLGEQYLIRAEARAEQGNMAGAVADLNLIRTRAGLPGLTATISLPNFLIALEYERREELCFEWGDRWFNLIRTNRANAVLGKKVGWKPTAVLYPIPYTEIQSNIKLTQNPGY